MSGLRYPSLLSKSSYIITNVPPCVERRCWPLGQNTDHVTQPGGLVDYNATDTRRGETNSLFRPLKIFLLWVCEYMSLFPRLHRSRKPVLNENYRGAGHAIDRFVGAIHRRFSYSPLLNHEIFFEVWRASGRKFIEKKHGLKPWNAALNRGKGFAGSKGGPEWGW